MTILATNKTVSKTKDSKLTLSIFACFMYHCTFSAYVYVGNHFTYLYKENVTEAEVGPDCNSTYYLIVLSHKMLQNYLIRPVTKAALTQ